MIKVADIDQPTPMRYNDVDFAYSLDGFYHLVWHDLDEGKVKKVLKFPESRIVWIEEYGQ